MVSLSAPVIDHLLNNAYTVLVVVVLGAAYNIVQEYVAAYQIFAVVGVHVFENAIYCAHETFIFSVVDREFVYVASLSI